MRLRLAASLWVATLLSATAAFAELRGVRVPPSFTLEEIGLIDRDARLAGAVEDCAWQVRQALDTLATNSDDTTSRVGVAGSEPCLHGLSGSGRASDEGALDILKILKDVSEQGTGRSGEGDGAGAKKGRSVHGRRAGAHPQGQDGETDVCGAPLRMAAATRVRHPAPWLPHLAATEALLDVEGR